MVSWVAGVLIAEVENRLHKILTGRADFHVGSVVSKFVKLKSTPLSTPFGAGTVLEFTRSALVWVGFAQSTC